jgi:hypothetical protein
MGTPAQAPPTSLKMRVKVERRESGLSTLVKRWFGGGFNTGLPRFAQGLPRTITASPELFLPIACLFVWQVTATAVKPAALGLALLLTALLFAYGYRVLGRTKWICRIGWVAPRRRFLDLQLPRRRYGCRGYLVVCRNPPPVPGARSSTASGPSGQYFRADDRGDALSRHPFLADPRILEATRCATACGRLRNSSPYRNPFRAVSQ